MKVFINEFDNDYRTVTETLEKEFDTIEQAEQWCYANKWSGYSYFIDRERNKKFNNIKPRLSKSEMFDFILTNNVEIHLDGSTWTKYDEGGDPVEAFRKKYSVSINGSGMSGFDLEEAIQYYNDNLLEDK